MRNTSLVHLERDGKYLMLHRIKRERDENRDKWVGIGGKFEPGESPEDCAVREVREETGLTMRSWSYRGIVTFVSDEWGTEYMHLFHSADFAGELKDCDEGVLAWRKKSELLNEKFINETSNGIQVLDSQWYTSVFRTEGFTVRGHFRFYSSCNRLVYVNEFQKHGYHRHAKILDDPTAEPDTEELKRKLDELEKDGYIIQ